jgi:pimeloyl-ACP methyl ester carboxylesterase
VERLVLYRSGYRSTPALARALARFAEPETWDRWGLRAVLEREHAPQGGPDAWKGVVRRVERAFAPDAPGASLPLEELARLDSPVLLIAGDRDDLVPLEDVVAMVRTLPDAALWVVPGAGHVLGMETWRRAAFQEEIRRFLESSPRGS